MLTKTDVDWIKARLTAIEADAHDTKPATTPPREYVVIHGGETGSPVERLAAVQVTDRQVWRLMCVSRSIDVLRKLTSRVRGEFLNARFGGETGPVIRELETGPELPDGDGTDTRYTQTITYAHHHPRSTTP